MRGAASERIAEEILKALGFEVLGRRTPVKIRDKVVAEVDLVVKPPGKPYAVEVKAGKVDVGSVRQAYANAKALGLEPMVVGSGWANEEARLLAEKLGVKYLMFQDLFVADKEELYVAVKSAIMDVLAKFVLSLEPSEEACELLEAKDLKEFQERVGKERAREIIKRLGKAGSWEAVLASAKVSCILWKLLENRG